MFQPHKADHCGFFVHSKVSVFIFFVFFASLWELSPTKTQRTQRNYGGTLLPVLSLATVIRNHLPIA